MDIQQIQWNNLDSVRVSLNDMELVVVKEFGPRIACFGKKGGRNFLFWDEENRSRNEWKLRGGHRIWMMTRGADESEMTYRPDNDPCAVIETRNCVVIWSALDPVNMTRKGIQVESTPHGNFKITSLIKNDGEMLLDCGIWALTCTLPGKDTEYAFPLGDDSGWDTFKSVQFRKWAFCDGSFGDDQFKMNSETLVVHPHGRQAKMMFYIPAGAGYMIDPETGLSFIKAVNYDETAQYPEGCNWAIYIGPDNYMVEFETMGSFSTLKPGSQKGHTEIWTLQTTHVSSTDRSGLLRIIPE